MSSFGARQAHAVCVPFPAQGHVNPMMQLAKLLHSKGFHITFVNTELIHRQVSRSGGLNSIKGLPDFRFETIPDGLPRSHLDDAPPDVPSLCDSTRKNCLEPFRELLRRLNSSAEAPPISCIVSDGIMTFCLKAAEELRIPQVTFWTASACSFMGYLYFSELIERGFIPFKEENFLRDGDTPIDWIPGLNNIQLKDLPSFLRTSNDELMFDFLRSETQNCLNSSSIIFNTFDELEHDVLEAIIASNRPRIYTIGPLLLLANHTSATESKSLGSSLWKEDSSCFDWLEKREPKSVVYVNFGSVALMRDENLKEFAWGLANSNHPFLWIIRPNLVMGESAVLSKEFLEAIGDRGLLVSWCPQDRVLVHPSIGVFLTHCGWNSILEAVCGGVPLICWHFFADQHTNSRYACVEWGIGVEVDHDVKRDEIEALVKEMIEGDRGKEMRQRALEWKKKGEEATDVGGSSYNNFTTFLNKEAALRQCGN